MFLDDVRSDWRLLRGWGGEAFECTQPWDALPEDGWQEKTRPLLETTPARPPYEETWIEWRQRSPMTGVAMKTGFALTTLGYADFRRYTDQPNIRRRIGAEIADSVRDWKNAGAVDVLTGLCFGDHKRNAALIAQIYVPLDEDGRVLFRETGNIVGFSVMEERLAQAYAVVGMAAERDEDAANMCWHAAYMLALMHVRNVVTVDHIPDAAIQRARIRRKKPPLVTYKTLHFVTPGEAARVRAGERLPPQGLLPIHLVRGHFSHFADEDGRRLFGKYHGTFWRPAHIRGSREAGIVIKDYEMAVKDGAI